MHKLRLYLASASPRRLELLRQAGFSPVLRPTDVDENREADEVPEGLVRRLAEVKARSAAARLRPDDPPGVVLAADTTVVIDGEVLGKPRDRNQAVEMLRRLSGREHEVLTGLFVLHTRDGRHHGEVCSTHVRFRELDEQTIQAYVATGEPMDKAGAYGLQGHATSFTERVDGSRANVIGLPIERLPDVLQSIGVELAQLL